MNSFSQMIARSCEIVLCIPRSDKDFVFIKNCKAPLCGSYMFDLQILEYLISDMHMALEALATRTLVLIGR